MGNKYLVKREIVTESSVDERYYLVEHLATNKATTYWTCRVYVKDVMDTFSDWLDVQVPPPPNDTLDAVSFNTIHHGWQAAETAVDAYLDALADEDIASEERKADG